MLPEQHGKDTTPTPAASGRGFLQGPYKPGAAPKQACRDPAALHAVRRAAISQSEARVIAHGRPGEVHRPASEDLKLASLPDDDPRRRATFSAGPTQSQTGKDAG